MSADKYVAVFCREERDRGDTAGPFIGAREAAMLVVVNIAYEEAIAACESLLTGHGKRKGGSDTADAARRGCIQAIRELRHKIPPMPPGSFGYYKRHGTGGAR
jgi:hypothetical protein